MSYRSRRQRQLRNSGDLRQPIGCACPRSSLCTPGAPGKPSSGTPAVTSPNTTGSRTDGSAQGHKPDVNPTAFMITGDQLYQNTGPKTRTI